MADLSSLKAKIDAAVGFISTENTVIDDEIRKALIAACDQLKGVLESPVDVASKLVFAVFQLVTNFQLMYMKWSWELNMWQSRRSINRQLLEWPWKWGFLM